MTFLRQCLGDRKAVHGMMASFLGRRRYLIDLQPSRHDRIRGLAATCSCSMIYCSKVNTSKSDVSLRRCYPLNTSSCHWNLSSSLTCLKFKLKFNARPLPGTFPFIFPSRCIYHVFLGKKLKHVIGIYCHPLTMTPQITFSKWEFN